MTDQAGMAKEVTLAVMAYGLYDSFDVRVGPNARIDNITALVLYLIGDKKPRKLTPAFSFEMSRHKWRTLKPDEQLSDYSMDRERINVCIWWDPVG